MIDRKRTKAQEKAMSDMVHDLSQMERDNALMRTTFQLVPPGWERATRNTPTGPTKKKMTIRLDPDVLDWFRGLGNGYQNRINAVLRAYMNAVISKYIEETKDRDWEDKPI